MRKLPNVTVGDLNIVVFDLETSSLDWTLGEVWEVAAVAYDPRSLEPYPESEGGLFHSRMRLLTPETAESRALQVGGVTVEELEKEPSPEVVWPRFCEWVRSYNRGKTARTAPVAAGKNIRAFDLHFVSRLTARWGPKKAETVLFNDRTNLDLEDDLYRWFAHDTDLSSFSMDAVRDHLGLERPAFHGARGDAEQAGAVLMRFLRLYRELKPRVRFSGGSDARR